MVTDIQPWPRIVMGEPARDMPERWNWTYPIAVARIAPHALYVGSQHLWRSVDEGESWAKISPDLTRAEPETLDDSGGPIVKDQDGPEIYGTLYAIAPSPHEPGTIWTGSDDGLVHVSRGAGDNWRDCHAPGHAPAHACHDHRRVPARSGERACCRDPVRDGRPTTTVPPGPESATAFPMAPSCASCEKIRSARGSCSMRAPSRVCSFPATAARSGATCRSGFWIRPSPASRWRSATWWSATHRPLVLGPRRHQDAPADRHGHRRC